MHVAGGCLLIMPHPSHRQREIALMSTPAAMAAALLDSSHSVQAPYDRYEADDYR
jgi:hypothetical protein